MAALRVAVLIFFVLLGAGCASRLERPLAPYESKVIEVAPSAPYETCVHLQAGDRFYFTYKADPALAFSIVRRAEGATISYLLHDLSRDESGIFFVPQTENYCLLWVPPPEEVPWPTLLRFTVQLNFGS